MDTYECLDEFIQYLHNLPEAILNREDYDIYIIDHMNRLIELKGEKIALLEMRSHAAWYIKGMKGATYVKREIAKVSTRIELIKIFEEYKEYLEKGPE